MTWWAIDLPAEARGSNCLACLVDGLEVRADFADRLGAPTCTAHFVAQVQAARVLLDRADGLERHRVNRRRGRAGGLAAAAAKARRNGVTGDTGKENDE